MVENLSRSTIVRSDETGAGASLVEIGRSSAHGGAFDTCIQHW
jgi:hypothetical protein